MLEFASQVNPWESDPLEQPLYKNDDFSGRMMYAVWLPWNGVLIIAAALN